MNKTAIVLAAGQGTRMKSKKPKVLHQVLGKPMVDWVLAALAAAGITEQVVVLGHQAEQVEAHLADRAQIVYQKEQLGTGHAVRAAADHLPDAPGIVVVACGDTPLLTSETLADFVAFHEAGGYAVTVMSGQAENPFGYGRILRQDGEVQAIVEEKDADQKTKEICEINAGTYCFERQFLRRALTMLTTDNAQGEYYLTDVIKIAAGEGRPVGGYLLADFAESLGVNNRRQLAEAEGIMRRRKLEALMDDGVTIIDPTSTRIAAEVQIGQDTIIYPGVLIEGPCVIGRDCHIGANSHIVDCHIGDGVQIHSSKLWQAQVGDGAQIGPFAYLRPGAKLGADVKIGDFVEVKASTIGPGSKIPHLSYVGDSIVGSQVNIGCGTITCNYDGNNKHQTVIGDGAFIGSNSNLIAPVTIGAEAYVGAGSTISKDVPDRALAVTRSTLTLKENWKK